MHQVKKMIRGPARVARRVWAGLSSRWQEMYWPTYFWVMDGPVGRYLLPVTESGLRRYAAGIARHPRSEFVREVKQFSMLHEELLALLFHFASISRGGILEIGTYIGGSTVAMAQAVAARRRPPITAIERGGRYEHDQIPSEDIIADLLRNLARFRLQDHVRLLRGQSSDPEIQAEVRKLYAPGSINLLSIDADGHVGRDIGLYGDLLCDGAVLVLDDYVSSGAPEKSVLIKKWVDEAVARGNVVSLGLWGWGTWVGIWRRKT